jgi:hypothetical protein
MTDTIETDVLIGEGNGAGAQPDGQGLAAVNPIFTWVRLAAFVSIRCSRAFRPSRARPQLSRSTRNLDSRGLRFPAR